MRNQFIKRIDKRRARLKLGEHARDLDFVCQMMKAEKTPVVSMCVPTTGKSLWVIRANNGGFWYDMEV